MSAIGDQQLIKLINQGMVYRMLKAKPGMSRAQLSHFTGLTKSTISLLVKELIEERWLVESEIHSKNAMGRPSTSIFLDSRSRSLIGVEFAQNHIRLVSVSTSGEIRLCTRTEHDLKELDAVLGIIGDLVLQANDQTQDAGHLLGGIGIAFAGVFDESTGTLRSSMDFNWQNKSIVEGLRLAFKKRGLSDIPFFVHSKNHCCAVGAYEFSTHRADTLMYLDFSQHIQMGIVLGDRICAGVSGTAGDIAHTFVSGDGPVCTDCGRKGCVDSLLSSIAIEKIPDPSVCISTLASLLHNLWKAFNPSIFVVGGNSVSRWPGLFEQAKQRFLQEHNEELDAPVVKLCRHGDLAAAIGAAALPHFYRLRPLESPAIAISRALDFSSPRLKLDTAHGHVSWT